MNPCCNIQKSVQDFYDSLFSFAISKVGNKEAAEDIVQEVMYRFSKAYQDNVNIQHIRGWLYQTSKYVIADYFRGIGTNIPLEELETYNDPDMENPIEADWQNECIRNLIKMLPEDYATPLYLSDIENVPQKDIAERLGMKLSAAKMRIQRARKMLYKSFLDCCNIVLDRNGAFVRCDVKDSCTPLVLAEKEFCEQNC